LPRNRTFLDTFLSVNSTSTEKILAFKNHPSDFIWGPGYLTIKIGALLIRSDFDFSKNIVTARYIKPDQINRLDSEPVGYYSRFTTKQDIKIWWEPDSNKIYAAWLGDETEVPFYLCRPVSPSLGGQKPCNGPFLIFESLPPIQNIDFFPQRKDVIIIAAGSGIYALEMDKRGQQNLQSIYKGKNPTFGIIKDTASVYILDESFLIKVELKSKP